MVGTMGDSKLPRKEADLFKSIVKFYETKNYRKGVKASDAILKKFPNHGETLAMKGLVLNCLERKAEAYEFVKRGLKNDVRSHVCWHVYGLLHRSDRRYGEAIKSYKQALRIEPDNVQILRDLSLLQIQTRDVRGFLATRDVLLRLKSTQKQNWISFAVANHMCDARDTAIKVIDAYTDTTRQSSSEPLTYEDSELALYRNSIIEEQGRFDVCLADLDNCKDRVLDKTSWREKRAAMLLFVDDKTRRSKNSSPETKDTVDNLPETLKTALRGILISQETTTDPSENNHFDSAIAAWADLLAQTPASCENYFYHRGFQCALLSDFFSADKRRHIMLHQTACETPADLLLMTDEARRRLDVAYGALNECLPRSETIKWVPLAYADKSTFVTSMDAILRRLVKKGAAALGSALERFFEPRENHVLDDQRPRGKNCCTLVLTIIDTHIASLRACGSFADLDIVKNAVFFHETTTEDKKKLPRQSQKDDDSKNPQFSEEEEEEEEEVVLEPPLTLFWALYLRSHCLEWLGDLESALETSDECTALVPTAVEVYEKKARLLKRSGDLEAAASVMDEARKLDLADRYINNKCTKYFLRCGRVDEARRVAALFTRPEARDAEQHLKDMQASWYELEVGNALLRRKELGPALKKFTQIAAHFADFVDDQFDFHTYCIRKMTLRAYVAMLRFEDKIRGHHGFRASAAATLRLWLRVYDEKEAADQQRRQDDAEKQRRYDDLAARDPAMAKAQQAQAEKKSAEDAAAAKARAKREKLKQRKAKAKEAASTNGSSSGAPATTLANGGEAAKGDNAETTAAGAGASTSAKEEPKNNQKNNSQPPGPVDDDPEGAKLLASERGPLLEAFDLVKKLEDFSLSWPDTHALAFDVALRRDKPLLALRALRRLRSAKYVEPRDPSRRGSPNKREKPTATFVDRLAVFCADKRYADRYLKKTDSPNDDDVVATVVRQEVADLVGAKEDLSEDLERAVRTFVLKFADTDAALPSRAAAARALARLDTSADAKRRAADLVCDAHIDDQRTGKPFPVDSFLNALDALKDVVGASDADVERFRTIAHRRFPRAPAFHSP